MIVAVPVITVHNPVPTTTILPLNVVVEAHTDCEVPANATVGKLSLTIAIVELETGQTPLLIVHWKTFVPTPNPVAVVVAEFGAVAVPNPDITVQAPTPITGLFAESVPDNAQTVCDAPATETEGGKSRLIKTVAVEAGQTPLVIDH